MLKIGKLVDLLLCFRCAACNRGHSTRMEGANTKLQKVHMQLMFIIKQPRIDLQGIRRPERCVRFELAKGPQPHAIAIHNLTAGLMKSYICMNKKARKMSNSCSCTRYTCNS